MVLSSADVIVIGGGLAGSEAAWQAANAGLRVVIYEMRPTRSTAAHQTGNCAELVCSNSFRADDATQSAIGLLHEEMRRCNSLIMQCADNHKIPAGGALAVDRDEFSREVTSKLDAHSNITIIREEITKLPNKEAAAAVIVATGPLTSSALTEDIKRHTGEDYLSFFDAIAPIVTKESINFDIAWFQSRYDKIGSAGGDGKDYINCPMNKNQYLQFIDSLLNANTVEFKDWEKNTPYFEGCLPIEVMAARGVETLRFGPMKPVGLTNPHNPDDKPYAVVQLRQDNKLGSLYNMVGFQTKLKWGEQKRVFRTIPALENADFVRLGGIHRNTFINSPRLLDERLRLKSASHIYFAGQITGVEGYVESAACGLLAGRFVASDIGAYTHSIPPANTALGAMLRHITLNANADSFQPMNINFGLFPELDMNVNAGLLKKRKYNKKERALLRYKLAMQELSDWICAGK